MSDLATALKELDDAITDEGPRPDVHRDVMARMQSSWPTLWQAIQNVRRHSDDLRFLAEKLDQANSDLQYWSNR